MNNRLKKYYKKVKEYVKDNFTLKNSGIVLGVVFSCLAYKKFQKYLESTLPENVKLSTFLQ